MIYYVMVLILLMMSPAVSQEVGKCYPSIMEFHLPQDDFHITDDYRLGEHRCSDMGWRIEIWRSDNKYILIHINEVDEDNSDRFCVERIGTTPICYGR